jgi:hypothetical protein
MQERPTSAGRLTELAVDIYRLLKNSDFKPEDIQSMTIAYQRAVVLLALQNSTEPFRELVSRYIIEVARTGEKDPEAICTRVFALMAKGHG